MKKQKKVALILGVTGQDGSYLADYLLSLEYEIYGLVRYTSNINYTNIKHILDNQNFHILWGDLGDQNSLHRALVDSNPDEIYHLAAMSQVWQSFKTPQYTANITGLGTLRVLEAMREYGKKDIKMYNAASSQMYGKMVQSPANQNTSFYPRSPYGVSKVFAYYMTKNYRQSYDMFCCSGIMFNHESPRRGKEFVTRKITYGIKQILNGKQDFIELGNIDSKRDWGYAPIFVKAMHLMLQQEQPDDYVVATGENHSVRQFLDIAFNYVGIKDWNKYIRINPELYRPAEVDVLVGDPSKIKSIGWQYNMAFKDLVETMMKEQLNISN